MKNIKLLVLAILSVLLVSFIYNNFFIKSMIVGEYINRNYNHSRFIPEIPYEQDTLRLFNDNRFTSRFWKKGTYKIFYSFVGTKIELEYEDQLGTGVFVGAFNRLSFGKPKILLDPVHNHYFEKQ